MEENKEMLRLLQEINDSNRKQTRWTMVLCGLLAVTSVCAVVLFIAVLNLLPQLEAIIPQLGTVMTQMETVLTDLETVTGELAEVDLQGMVTNVDSLVSTAEESLKATMDKLNAINFETLNKAIEDLAAVIDPIAKFFNRFG